VFVGSEVHIMSCLFLVICFYNGIVYNRFELSEETAFLCA
jgi:uncharacterized membrane protein AbrB (regulator of aidB expression)